MEKHDEKLLSKSATIKGLDWLLPPEDQESSVPNFDVAYFLNQAKDFEMSEQEKIELLTILWDIMKRFVELGWGLDSISLLDQLQDDPELKDQE